MSHIVIYSRTLKTPGEKRPPRFAAPLAHAFVCLPGAVPMTIEEIEWNNCRWPIDNGNETLYCGNELIKGSYCEAHRALSFGKGTQAERKIVKEVLKNGLA